MSYLVITLIIASELQFSQIICFRKISENNKTGFCLVIMNKVSKGDEC